MREIKFRLLLNGKVVGYEKWYPGAGERAEAQWLYSDDGKYWNPARISHTQKDQFTGLLDKNGKEIYEGDVVFDHCWDECAYIIAFGLWNNDLEYDSHKAGYGWHFQRKDGSQMEFLKCAELDDCQHYEVIGNIHENPELIAGKY